MTTSALPAPSRAALRDCLAAIERGERGAAVALARALAADAVRATRAVGVRLLYLLRLYQEALDALETDLRRAPDDPYAHRLRYSLLKRLRFEEEAHAALQALLAIADDARVHEAAVLHYQGMGDARAALRHLEPVMRAGAAEAHRHRAELRLAVEAGDLERARRAAAAALARDPARWLEVVDKLLEAGAFDAAERVARGHAAAADGRAVLGQLALYRGESAAAYAHAEHAAAPSPSERAVTVMVGASLLAGDLERARRDLDRWSGPLGPTLATWRAELLLRQGALDEARAALSRVQNEVSDYLAAKLLFVLANCDPAREPWATPTAYDGLLEGQLQALGVDVHLADDRLEAEALRRAAADGLACLGGNRSPFPSLLRDGALVAVRVPASPRHRAREVQHQARWLGLEPTRRALAAELARIGPHPIAECYEAELDLWSGDHARARAQFEDILGRAPRTTWAWIGRGASEVLGGDAARGLATLDEGVRTMGWRGATLPIYRGEALFRLGRLDEAAAELGEACATHPGRVSAWVLRVLVEHARGASAARDEAFAHLDAAAAALLADAAAAAGLDGWWPGPADAATQVRVAEQALALMRGNRSSSCAFWIPPGRTVLRSVMHRRPVTTSEWELAERRQLRALT